LTPVPSDTKSEQKHQDYWDENSPEARLQQTKEGLYSSQQKNSLNTGFQLLRLPDKQFIKSFRMDGNGPWRVDQPDVSWSVCPFCPCQVKIV